MSVPDNSRWMDTNLEMFAAVSCDANDASVTRGWFTCSAAWGSPPILAVGVMSWPGTGVKWFS